MIWQGCVHHDPDGVHKNYWQLTSSRKAAISKAANIAAGNGNDEFGTFLMGLEVDMLKMDIGGFLFPILPMLDHL